MTSNKTKEMIVTFSSEQRQMVEEKPVEISKEFRYLGTISDNMLKFSPKTKDILRR